MRRLRGTPFAVYWYVFTFTLAFFNLTSFFAAASTTELTFAPGGLTLAANQSVSTGPVTLLMRSDCILVLRNASGQTLWQSAASEPSCSSPQAAFERDGNLVVSSSMKGQRTTLWASHTSGSSKLILSQTVPCLEINNSDGSSAWKALGALTLNDIDPPLVATIGARGGLYSRAIQKRPALPLAAGDRVDNFQAADGDEVQIMIKAPAPKNARVYEVPPYPMTAGQKVLDYLSGAIAYATGSNPDRTTYGKVVFPKATYEVEDFPGCDDGRGANGNQHWEIASVADLVIDGQGSTLNFNGLCKGIEMDWVQRIEFKNFNVDWPRVHLAALATVQSVDPKAGTMKLLIDSNYHIDKNTVIEAVTSWDRRNNYWSLTHPAEDESLAPQGCMHYKGGQTCELPEYVRFQAGDTVIARYYGGEAPAFNVNDSQDVTLENVNVYAATGSGFIFSFDRGIHLANSKITRLPGSDRLISIAGDGVHMSADQGDILIEGNTIGYQGDDGLNLNASMWCKSKNPGSNAQPCNPSLAGPSGGPASSLIVYNWFDNLWQPGDPLGFFNSNFSLSSLSKVQSVAGNPHVSTEIQFNKPSPANAQFVADLNYGGARYIIRKNTFLHNRARGVLLQTSEGLVTGNTFDGQTMHSIYVITSPFWGEGPGAQNLTVANNTISNSGNYVQDPSAPGSVLGAVVVAAEDNKAFTISSSAPLHQNMIFSDNTVQNTPGPGFFISTTNNVILQHNQLANTNQSNAFVATYGTASSKGSIVVTRASNVFFHANKQSGSSGPISIDTHSTSGITALQ